jgi:hypothetical protein
VTKVNTFSNLNAMRVKREFIRGLIVKSDLEALHKELSTSGKGILDMVRSTRHMFVVADNLAKLFQATASLTRSNAELVDAKKSLRRDLEHISYLRNRIGGHLDTKILAEVVRTEPVLFAESLDRDTQLLLSSVRLLDVSINSKTDDLGIPLVFNDFFDFEHPGDQHLLSDWLHSFVESAITATSAIIDELDLQIRRSSEDEVRAQTRSLYMNLQSDTSDHG